MTKKINKSKGIAFLLSSVFFTLFAIINGGNIFVLTLTIELIVCILFCWEHIDRRIIFMLFSISFYLFLIGKPILEEIFNYPSTKPYPVNIDNLTYLLLFLSYTTLLLTYIALEANQVRFSFGNRSKNLDEIVTEDKYTNNPYNVIRKWSIFLYYFTYPAYFLILFDRISFVNLYGYTESYISYSVSLPYVIRLAGEICPYALALFMATMPLKKEFRVPLVLQLIYYVLSLSTGRRMYFMTGILILVAYYVIRNSIDRGEGKWLQKKHLLLLVLLGPIIVIYMLLMQYTRVDKSFHGNALEAIIEFFYRQGYSVNIIKMAVEGKSNLNNHPYMLYDTLKYLRTNIITKLFVGHDFDFEYINAVNTALYSNSLAHAFSYQVYPNAYLYGYGVGSSYVAESYVDLGYIGVIFSSFIYGLFIYLISTVRRNSIVLNMTVFMLLEKLFMSPRYNFDRVFISIIDPTFLLFVLATSVLEHVYSHKDRKL